MQLISTSGGAPASAAAAFTAANPGIIVARTGSTSTSDTDRPSSAVSPWKSAATIAPRLPAFATIAVRGNTCAASRARASLVDTRQCG